MSANIIAFPSMTKSQERVETEKNLAAFFDTIQTIGRLGQQIGNPNLILDLMLGIVTITANIENGIIDEITRLPDRIERGVDYIEKRREKRGNGHE